MPIAFRRPWTTWPTDTHIQHNGQSGPANGPDFLLCFASNFTPHFWFIFFRSVAYLDICMTTREGSLEPPKRHPLDWENPDFYDEPKLFAEMERVFDICHGCRRCVNLCTAFPSLFDLIDDGSDRRTGWSGKQKFWEVADRCYLCDMCFMTKCPYVPPHPWNVDFPHLMLRAKAVKYKKGDTRFRDKLLSSTDAVGKLASIPVVAQTVNAVNKAPAARKLMDNMLGIHAERKLPEYDSHKFRPNARAKFFSRGSRRLPDHRGRSRSMPPATSITMNRASGMIY